MNKSNFLIVSSFNNDISWLSKLPNSYIVYERGDAELKIGLPSELPSEFQIREGRKVRNIGYNLYDYFTFIIENYDSLPDVMTFCKGNIFPRHMSQERFMELMNNKTFTPLFDHTYNHRPELPVSMFSCDGLWCEQNNNTILINPSEGSIRSKYFTVYNELLRFIFVNPVIPRYITFAPGGNYVVPKENILKYSVQFYKNLLFFISHCQLPTEAHLIERALYTIWMGNFASSKRMETVISEDNFGNAACIAESTVNIDVNNSANPINVRYEIRIKDPQPPYLYIPILRQTLMNKPECANLFTVSIDSFTVIHHSLFDAEAYLRDEILQKIIPGKYAEFTIEKVYAK